jgi:hypothetical protein
LPRSRRLEFKTLSESPLQLYSPEAYADPPARMAGALRLCLSLDLCGLSEILDSRNERSNICPVNGLSLQAFAISIELLLCNRVIEASSSSIHHLGSLPLTVSLEAGLLTAAFLVGRGLRWVFVRERPFLKIMSMISGWRDSNVIRPLLCLVLLALGMTLFAVTCLKTPEGSRWEIPYRSIFWTTACLGVLVTWVVACRCPMKSRLVIVIGSVVVYKRTKMCRTICGFLRRPFSSSSFDGEWYVGLGNPDGSGGMYGGALLSFAPGFSATGLLAGSYTSRSNFTETPTRFTIAPNTWYDLIVS